MNIQNERRRVLLTAQSEAEASFRALFQSEPLQAWELLFAESVEAARFTIQHTPCDVLLIDENLCQRQWPDGLTWLSRIREVPLVVLHGDDAATLPHLYEEGAMMCLSRRGCLEQPLLLAAGLGRAADMIDLLRAQARTRDSLHVSRRQVDRLVNLLWRTTPLDPHKKWLTQRHLMDRLQEEIARSQRHGLPLTVALGEIGAEEMSNEEMNHQVEEWTTEQINLCKRRCDVAGQYGLKGFLLLLVNTARQGGVACCRRLQQSLEQATGTLMGPRGPIRSYFGLASFETSAATPLALLSRAEKHLSAAKMRAAERIVAE